MNMNHTQEIIDNLILELKRGTLVMSVLSELHQPQYGYSLVQSLEEKKIPIEAGTLYPLLRRLEGQHLLSSEWETTGPKPRKYYVISQEGLVVLNALQEEWLKLSKQMNKILNIGEK
jgi:PadR family transcriptional regulator PadR